jgi:hypothetical protein
MMLLGGLYIGFIGRILLKDFRDVRGDALFGKRTFLVRYGRRRTCAVSAVCWIAGTLTLTGVRALTFAVVACFALFVAVALGLLRALAVERGARRDEAIISAIAIVGRGMIVTLIGHLSMTDARWPAVPYFAVMASLAVVMLGLAAIMARQGPTSRLTVPQEWGADRLILDLAVVDRRVDGKRPPEAVSAPPVLRGSGSRSASMVGASESPARGRVRAR